MKTFLSLKYLELYPHPPPRFQARSSDGRPPSSSLLLPPAANSLYCQSSRTFSLQFGFAKIPIYNHFFTSSHNLPVAPRSVLSFRYFAEATFHFQFFQILIFRGAHTNTSVPHAAILGSLVAASNLFLIFF